MISTAQKISTLRTATAEGRILINNKVIQRLLANELPKHDALATAKVAGMLASKRVPELLPHCHPVGMDGLEIELTPGDGHIAVRAEAIGIARTGYEMEALTAASVALLCLYDMTKGHDENLSIEAVKLTDKSGGKSDFPAQAPERYRAAVIVTSDRCFKGTTEDKTGPYLVKALQGFGVAAPQKHVIPDEAETLKKLVLDLCGQGMDLILTTGGTGLSPRDITAETIKELLTRELPGAAEAARGFGQARTPYAMLSRAVVGSRGRTLIATLPGSQGGVKDGMAALFPYLFHAHHVMGRPSQELVHA
jgi:cyclic pyranopterin phosphate synthase